MEQGPELSQNRVLVGKVTLLLSLVASIVFIALLFGEQPGSGLRISPNAKWIVLAVGVISRAVSAWAIPRKLRRGPR